MRGGWGGAGIGEESELGLVYNKIVLKIKKKKNKSHTAERKKENGC